MNQKHLQLGILNGLEQVQDLDQTYLLKLEQHDQDRYQTHEIHGLQIQHDWLAGVPH